jgi:hypothetical protein
MLNRWCNTLPVGFKRLNKNRQIGIKICEYFLEQRKTVNNENSSSMQLEENVVVYYLVVCVCSTTRPKLIEPVITVKQIQDLKSDILPHVPYSPDLVPRDFHLVSLLKKSSTWT